jgi:hypothetical protein
MNKLIFKTLILFIIFINTINCNNNNNIEKMINDLKKEFKSLEYNVNTQLKDFKNEKNEGIIIIIINCLFIYIFNFIKYIF